MEVVRGHVRDCYKGKPALLRSSNLMDGNTPLPQYSEAKQDEFMLVRLHVPSPLRDADACLSMRLHTLSQSGTICIAPCTSDACPFISL